MSDSSQSDAVKRIARLRRIAAEILRRYGIEQASLKFLSDHRQTTFQVHHTKRQKKYLLRLHTDQYRSPSSVRAEFEWLRFLGMRLKKRVPTPQSTLTGEEVIRVTCDGFPSELNCSMLSWVDGKRYFRKTGPGRRVMHEVGMLMARMHQLAEQFTPSSDFQCPVWNQDRLFSKRNRVSLSNEQRMLGKSGSRRFNDVESVLTELMKVVGTTSNYGIIHGDLMQANFVISRRQVRVIDFADMGYGHFLYDMGIPLFGLCGLDPEGRQRNSYLAGYREIRPLTLKQESQLNLFIAARIVMMARFVIHSPFAADRQIAPRYVAKILRELDSWLN